MSFWGYGTILPQNSIPWRNIGTTTSFLTIGAGLTTAGDVLDIPTVLAGGTFNNPSSITVNNYGQITAITAGGNNLVYLTTTFASLTTLTTARQGAIAIVQTDANPELNGSYVLTTNIPTVLANWLPINTPGAVSSVSVTAPITNTGTALDPVIAHANSGVAAGTFAVPYNIAVNATGHITSMLTSSNAWFTVASPSTILSVATGGTFPNRFLRYDHNISGVTAGTYTNATLTFNTTGHCTAAVSGVAPVASVSATSPINITGIATTPIVNHNTSGVIAGSYTLANITVDTFGHITAASNGTAVSRQIYGVFQTVSAPVALTDTIIPINSSLSLGSMTLPANIIGIGNNRGLAGRLTSIFQGTIANTINLEIYINGADQGSLMSALVNSGTYYISGDFNIIPNSTIISYQFQVVGPTTVYNKNGFAYVGATNIPLLLELYIRVGSFDASNQLFDTILTLNLIS